MAQDEAQKGFKITDKQAENITRVEELAYELQVDEVMTKDVKTLDPDMPMADALDLFRSARISGAPVTVNNYVVGVISLEDLIRWLSSGSMESTVDQYMSTTLVVVHCQDPVVEALKLFVNSRHGRLPVLDDNDHMVGILTKGDITLGLLQALQRDYHVEELRTYRASHLFEDIVSDRTSLMLRYTIEKGDFTHGGTASSYIKRALLRMGATPQITRRLAIAAYEAEMNLIIHTNNGGVMRLEIEPHQITLEAYDDGPGIKNIELAMRPGYSTATEEIRELGFGAGMGLVNIQRCVDNMILESTYGKGTRLRMKLFLQKPEGQPEVGDNKL
jgi:CBS domain-containing protein/anti-sigma regulatory factor (Ser/Thr protein kinase)